MEINFELLNALRYKTVRDFILRSMIRKIKTNFFYLFNNTEK